MEKPDRPATTARPFPETIRPTKITSLENAHRRIEAQAVVAERAGVCTDTIVKVSKAYADRGGDVQASITRKKRETPPVAPIVTGEVEARVIAMACTEPPEGRDRWSLRLLEKHVRLTDDLPDLDHSTIGRVLKKGDWAGPCGVAC